MTTRSGQKARDAVRAERESERLLLVERTRARSIGGIGSHRGSMTLALREDDDSASDVTDIAPPSWSAY